MKTIKIFLASSEELDYDRQAFGNLVRKLDKIYEKRGIRIELFEWEDYDAAFNGVRKQDEYNDYVRNSDMFLALFHIKAGKFTIEEFDIATEEFKKHASPKVYTYCKDLQPGEEESPELKEFKKRLFEELGHYWCRYDNSDSMQLHFVMQLQLVENSQSDALKVENGEVTLDGHHIASMDKLKFAAANEDYVRMNERLASLSKDIEGLRMTLLQLPDNEFLNNSLQEKLNEYNKLKEEFAEYQKLLFDTAKRVTQLQGERITERMRRAMDAFSEGKVREANIILDEVEADAQRNLEDYRQSKEITEQKRQTVINSIEELLLKTSTVMADATLPIEERIARTESLYEKADTLAAETDYEKKKYAELLLNYAHFLYKFAKYDKAILIYQRQIQLSKNVYGPEHSMTATSYNDLAAAYVSQSDYSKSLRFLLKSLAIYEKEKGKENPFTAILYGNIGGVYHYEGDYQNAQYYICKSLEINEKILGKDHPHTATSYSQIGVVYENQGDYSKALKCFFKALEIQEKSLGKEHLDTARTYDNIGLIYKDQCDYQKAMEYYFKSLVIREKVFGKEHPYIARSLKLIGGVYKDQCDYMKALEYYSKALEIEERVFCNEHTDIAITYNNLGQVYCFQHNYPKALECYFKALAIIEKVLGMEHSYNAIAYNDIGFVHYLQSNYSQALEYYNKALSIWEKALGKEHAYTAEAYDNIGEAYRKMGDNLNALTYRLKYLDYCIKKIGEKNIKTANTYNSIGAIYRDLAQYDKSLKYIGKALEIAQELKEIISVATYHNRLGRVYALIGDKENAQMHFQTAIDMLSEDHLEALDSRERIQAL